MDAPFLAGKGEYTSKNTIAGYKYPPLNCMMQADHTVFSWTITTKTVRPKNGTMNMHETVVLCSMDFITNNECCVFLRNVFIFSMVFKQEMDLFVAKIVCSCINKVKQNALSKCKK